MKALFSAITTSSSAIFLVLLGAFFSKDEPSIFLLTLLIISGITCTVSFCLLIIAGKFKKKDDINETLQNEIEDLKKELSKCHSEIKKISGNNNGLKEQLSSYKKENRSLQESNSSLLSSVHYFQSLAGFLMTEASEKSVKKAERLQQFILISDKSKSGEKRI